MEDEILSRLVVKPEQLEREQKSLLVNMVFPFAAIEPENGRVHFKAPFDELNARHKILVYLMARLALSAFPDAKFPASTAPKEVESELNLPGGTVRPKLVQLADERFIRKGPDGYYISPAALSRVFKELQSIIPET